MNKQISLPLEIEQRRQSLLDEMVAENGQAWLAEYAPGSFGCHELLDRVSLAAEAIERTLVDHPACVQNAEWYALAEQTVDALNSLYQLVGASHLADGDNP